MERTRSGPLTRQPAGWIACIVLTALLAFACGDSRGSFSGLLARIDADQVSAGADLYTKAAKLAATTEDRLRILKRASRTKPKVYADTARAVLSAGAVTGPVIMAIVDALIEDGAYLEALGLFDGTIDPNEYPSAYAEILVRCQSAGYAPAISMERAVLCTDVTGDFRWMLGAAIDAMVAGDRGTATLLLADAENKGHAMPYRLLWDARMLQVLADRIPHPSDPLELAVCADSANLLGKEATAAFLYSSILARFPDWSWKPYAALARQSAEPAMQEERQWPHSPLEGSWEQASSPVEMVERLHRIMEVKFPHSTGAAIERARWLYGQGRLAEAAAVVPGDDAESAAARLRMAPLDRVVPLAHRGAAMYPESGTVADIALEMLASTGSWGDFRQMLAGIEHRGTDSPRLWFWRALMKAIDGDPAGAALDIRKYGSGLAGYTGIIDIAMLELAAGNHGKARDAALVAAGMGKTGLEKSRALIVLGDAEHAAGSHSEARDAYMAALNADPESRIARSRLERLDVPR
jgi:tetratricopeptide (TPR) repeat protein